MKLALIAAVADNGVLGYQNQLPWQLPADLKYFKQRTLNKAVIMGRKTYESIGRPLPQRHNIIVTRDKNFQTVGCFVCYSLEDALLEAENYSLAAAQEEILIMGGAQLYEQALSKVQRLYLTRVHLNPVGDAYFPTYDDRQWQLIEAEHFVADEKNLCDYSFLVLDRK